MQDNNKETCLTNAALAKILKYKKYTKKDMERVSTTYSSSPNRIENLWKKSVCSQKDLDWVTKAYSDNFEKLMKEVGTPRHAKYLTVEDILNDVSAHVKGTLNQLATDPCTKKKNASCGMCGETNCYLYRISIQNNV